jgi:hypothetical protein
MGELLGGGLKAAGTTYHRKGQDAALISVKATAMCLPDFARLPGR